MASNEGAMRPNIRIEIQNNLIDESMQVDDDAIKLNSEEEGEISDENEEMENEVVSTKITFPNVTSGTRQWPNTESFETGINVFDKEEQEKLQVRAQRFGINPDESQATNDIPLQKLHDSLGITSENEKNIRFEAIHMNGTEEMSTQDVFTYFEIYAPGSVEWVDDVSCNVVWNDQVSAARALLRLSDPIGGMPVEGPCDPFAKENDLDESNSTNKGRSILLIDKNDKYDKENSGTIHISDITAPVPPGYWRLGKPTEKNKFILLRYAQKTDKKPFRAERFSQYYKKYGNPNFGGLKGIISESKKKKMKGIFDRHEESKTRAPEPPVSGNPWGSLAKNWSKDHRVEKTPEEFPPLHLDSSAPPAVKSTGILKRLGHKRAVSSDPESDTEKAEPKKSKVPRMRMYADEEEEKIKQRKALKLLGKIQADIPTKKPDLRSKLNQTDNRPVHIQRTSQVPLMRPERDFRDVRNRISRQEVPHFAPRVREERREVQEEEDEEEEQESDHEQYDDGGDDSSYQQKSKVMVIIKKQHKPTVASTVWSRMNDKKMKKKKAADNMSEEEEEEDCSDDDSVSESDEAVAENREKLKIALRRPGFSSGSLKSRLGMATGEHKSPLRIEINNDLFKNKTAKK